MKNTRCACYVIPCSVWQDSGRWADAVFFGVNGGAVGLLDYECTGGWMNLDDREYYICLVVHCWLFLRTGKAQHFNDSDINLKNRFHPRLSNDFLSNYVIRFDWWWTIVINTLVLFHRKLSLCISGKFNGFVLIDGTGKRREEGSYRSNHFINSFLKISNLRPQGLER